MTGGPSGIERDLMTVGALARRTGLSIKAIRQYEALGLIYSAGRSEGNYRTFDESALWCVDVVRQLRGLGMTIKEIQALATTTGRDRGEPVGPHLGALLDLVEERIDARLAELTATRRRIGEYRMKHAAVLSGHAEPDLTAQDPRRRRGA